MHWYLSRLLSRCADIRHEMCRPAELRELNLVDACAHLSLLKGLLERYHKKQYDNGFADHAMGRYILGMVMDDLQDAIVTVLEKAISDCRITITDVADELTEDLLRRVILNRLSMLTYKAVCGQHIMCGNWVIDNITATKKADPDDHRVDVKFCSGGHESFSAEFRCVNGMWVCLPDLAEKYIADLTEMGCEVARIDT